ncbi:sensor histidine kinase [Flammeovirgaceae bacterium SG7u.111]|nr:sensor histidine kinase [Flammeovirgaceae bacterium SG7u.111]
MANNFQYEEAISLCFDIIQQAEKVENDSAKGYAFIRLGTIYCDLAKEEIGKIYYFKAKNVARKINDLHLNALSNYGIAAAYQHLHHYDSAIFFYNEAIPYFESVDDSLTLSYFYSNLSLLYSKIDSIGQMEAYSKMALSIQIKYDDHKGIGVSLSNLGLAAMHNEEYYQAIEKYKNSLPKFRLIDNKKGYSESLRWIGVCYYKLGEYDSASYYFYRYEMEGHDLYHQDYQDQILELETKYKTSEIEKDIAVKQAEIEKNQKQIAILIVVIIAIIIIATIGFLLVRQKRLVMKANAEKAIQDLLQQQEIKTAYALLEGQDLERKRIASELHDNLGSILTSLNMFSDALRSKTEPEKIKEIASKISETSQIANQEVRAISHSLDAGLLNHFGLKTAIQHLMEAIQASKSIAIELELQIESLLENETALEVYRIIQELVNNTLKHANCSKIRVDISHVEKEMSIIFYDNGVGFDLSKVERGMGLSNIENRVLKLGGELSIESEVGKGSTFIIELPNI